MVLNTSITQIALHFQDLQILQTDLEYRELHKYCLQLFEREADTYLFH